MTVFVIYEDNCWYSD